jgi:hypothetical protein
MAKSKFTLQVLASNAMIKNRYPCTYLTYCFLRIHYSHKTVCDMVVNIPGYSDETLAYYEQMHGAASVEYVAAKPVCKITSDKVCWVLDVDGQRIAFKGFSSTEYFAEHYERLGYEIVKENWS